MNHVDYLSTVRFSTLPIKQQLEIKHLGPHQPDELVIIQEGNGKKRSFNPEWFYRKSWLTASISKKALFCFPCLLFEGESVWTTTGFTDLKHLSERLAKHESCASHVDNSIRLGLLGQTNVSSALDRVHGRDIEEHNRQTEENRYVLGRIISCMKLCGRCGSAGSLNPAIFKCIFETMCEGDSRLRRHYEAEPYFSGISSAAIQNELLDCMYSVYRDEVGRQLLHTPFVAVMTDECTDGSCNSHMAVVLRYMVNNTVIERFWEFIEVKDKTANGLATAIMASLDPLHITNKLIAQTYDGSAGRYGSVRDIEARVKQRYPLAHFVHCYAHPLNATLQQVCSARSSDLKVFFADLSTFTNFFSNSYKRMAALNEALSRRVPRRQAARLNFISKTANSVWKGREEIKECLQNIRTQEGWDKATISEAYALAMHLQDPKFLQFSQFFSELMPEVDLLHGVLQKRKMNASGIRLAIQTFKKNVGLLRERTDLIAQEGTEGSKRIKSDAAATMQEACDAVLSQVDERFSESDHLIAARLVDGTLFPKFASSFPVVELEFAARLWPVANKEKLKTELTSLYQHVELIRGTTMLSLLNSVHEYNLQDVMSETVTLLKVIITTPMTNSESDRNLSTLKKVKTFAQNATGQHRLNALAMLTIENGFIHGLLNFDSKVIEQFAHMKDRCATCLFMK
ncbi:uncharacterized protein LOC114661764 [Erpetoichthys calabaricus]|uniref:uncharacterized protein LOC114661764 n=1 Tax=Erpetoichthys calabaricus TaxID=27687 RepID=UPI00109F0F5D|nr:uncharacterized protein LOC114661764 [Erpetoichthys calabaricus]